MILRRTLKNHTLFSYARQPEHSTYLVAHDLKSLDYVRQIDYAQFDYIYLMAAPNWKEY